MYGLFLWSTEMAMVMGWIILIVSIVVGVMVVNWLLNFLSRLPVIGPIFRAIGGLYRIVIKILSLGFATLQAAAEPLDKMMDDYDKQNKKWISDVREENRRKETRERSE